MIHLMYVYIAFPVNYQKINTHRPHSGQETQQKMCVVLIIIEKIKCIMINTFQHII